MKKTILLIFLLCVSLLLSACTATDPDNLFEMPQDDVVNSENTQPNITHTGSYPYGNMQLTGGVGFLLLDNEVVFKHTENGKALLYTYNLDTEEVRFYCDDATCRHTACVSADFFARMEVYEGKLYGILWTKEQGNHYYPAVGNGNDTEPIIEADVQEFIHYGDKLYVYTFDNSLMVLEEGQDEPQMILDEFIGYGAVVVDDYLYAVTQSDYIRLNLTDENPKEELLLSNVWAKTDGEHIYYVDANTYRFYRCDMDGNNPERLLKKKVGVNFNFDDEYVYYTVPVDITTYKNTDTHDIYRFPKDDPTKVEKIATLPEAVWYIYTVPGTGKIFARNYIPDSSVKPVKYVMNSDGSNLKKLELPEA